LHGIKKYDWRNLIVLNSGRTLTDRFYVLTEINGVESEKSTFTSIGYIEELDIQESEIW